MGEFVSILLVTCLFLSSVGTYPESPCSLIACIFDCVSSESFDFCFYFHMGVRFCCNIIQCLRIVLS